MPPQAAHANPAHAPAPPAAAQSGGPGMLAQMAATAGSVAVGSTIGHGLSHMLFGGSNSAAPAPEPAAPVQQQSFQSSGMSCEGQAKEFTRCLEKADLPSCSWYLEQLKAVRVNLMVMQLTSLMNLVSSVRQPLLLTDEIWVVVMREYE
jgi:hypothetical protein